jgi:DedD protein
MREGAKQRLIGATVIVALIVIFVPMLFEDRSVGDLSPPPESIPQAPDLGPDVRSEVFLGPEDSGVGGLDGSEFTASQPLDLPPAGDLEPADPSNGGGIADPAPEAGASEPAEPVADTPPAPTGAAGSPTSAEPGAAPARGLPGWVIQVASLGTSESAGELEGRLRAGGFSAFVEKAEVNGKMFYRVRVGPEADRGNAERTAAQLRERHKLDTLIQPYP